jgi:serine/threonine protein kinase
MGSVYEAHDEKMKRTVALKVMAGHLAPSQKAGLRFEQEAWIAGKLDHPNLVKVYDRGAWQDLRYFAMELVDGGSLHDVIQNLKKSGRDARWNLEFGSREYIHWRSTRWLRQPEGWTTRIGTGWCTATSSR